MSAMFAVSGELLSAYPESFYEQLRKYLIYDDFKYGQPLIRASEHAKTLFGKCAHLRQGGVRGYMIERLWQYIFTGRAITRVQRNALLSTFSSDAAGLPEEETDVQPIAD